MGKRLFDLVATTAVLALIWPLLVAIWLAVVVTSGPPGLFRQERIGWHQRPFRLLKFRTMRTAPPGTGPQVTARGDARITPIGRWLRATKLDELPQLLNVMRGDMSLVGPRPEVQRYVEHYSPEQRAAIYSVRPGITDEATILFRDEESLLASADDPEDYYVRAILPRKIACYQAYASQHSLRGDLGILLRTLGAIALR